MKPDEQRIMLGEHLVRRGIVTPDQLRIVLTEQKRLHQPLGRLLVEMGFVPEAMLRDMLGESLGHESIDLAHVVVDPEALRLIPKEFAKRNNLLPLMLDAEVRELTVAMANTQDVVALDKVRARLGEAVTIRPVLAGAAEIATAIEQFFGFELSIDGIIQEIESGALDAATLETQSNEYAQPMVRLVDALLMDAVKKGASDIHIEPEEHFLGIRYRIDGVLRRMLSLHRKYQSPITVRIKVMSGMNIAENRTPQDGHIGLQLFGRPVDFRVSVMPTTHGENIVLRILDRARGIMPLGELGFSEESQHTVQLMLARPLGIILVTGPTGSGKTTTLYSMLDTINEEGINIMTLEDPVEYPMRGIRQSQVNTAARMGFADGIRAMLRQDPDIMLVGEIRDEETAHMALRAAMTGHQVFATVHANSALQALTRLLDIGLPADLMAGNIIGVMAQRLARRLCSHCKEGHAPNAVERRLLGLDEFGGLGVEIYDSRGCPRCDGVGYKGRTALVEVIRFDAELDTLLARRVPYLEIQQAARRKGFHTLAQDGIRRVLEGATSLDEVSRVVDLTENLE